MKLKSPVEKIELLKIISYQQCSYLLLVVEHTFIGGYRLIEMITCDKMQLNLCYWNYQKNEFWKLFTVILLSYQKN